MENELAVDDITMCFWRVNLTVLTVWFEFFLQELDGIQEKLKNGNSFGLVKILHSFKLIFNLIIPPNSSKFYKMQF